MSKKLTWHPLVTTRVFEYNSNDPVIVYTINDFCNPLSLDLERSISLSDYEFSDEYIDYNNQISKLPNKLRSLSLDTFPNNNN